MEETRKCKVCGKEKSIYDFYNPQHKTYTCKRCICKINSDKKKQLNLLKYPDLPNEVWKDIEGYEGIYKISNYGRIRSFTAHGQKGIILKPFVHRQGYLRVCLTNPNGTSGHYLVHRLAAMAFLQNPEHKETVNHKDGNKSNNYIHINIDGSVNFEKSNLEWATQKENNVHAWRTGLSKITDKRKEAMTRGFKLSRSKVSLVISDYNNGTPQYKLAEKYGVSRAQISRIVRGKSRNQWVL